MSGTSHSHTDIPDSLARSHTRTHTLARSHARSHTHRHAPAQSQRRHNYHPVPPSPSFIYRSRAEHDGKVARGSRAPPGGRRTALQRVPRARTRHSHGRAHGTATWARRWGRTHSPGGGHSPPCPSLRAYIAPGPSEPHGPGQEAPLSNSPPHSPPTLFAQILPTPGLP